MDLDLGNYERFLDITLTKDNNLTTGKIYQVGACEPAVRLWVAFSTLSPSQLHASTLLNMTEARESLRCSR